VTRLNVLYLIRTWALGGSHTIILLLLKHLPADRFNILVAPYDAFTDGDAQFVSAARRQGLQVLDERIPWRSRAAWFTARNTIAGLIRRQDVHLVHAHDTLSNVLVGLGRRRWPCACVASPYGWWEGGFQARARLNHWIERNLALPHFDRVITVSNDMKRKILQGRTPEDRIRVIHTGLDLADFEAGAAREEARRALGIPPHACVVGTVSRLFAEKGHRYLLDACATLIPDLPHLRALIVGTGDLRPALERQATQLGIADRVIFTGFYEDLHGALNAMDVFAQPSVLEEGFPTAILEAQAAGLPVVASDVGGTRETLDVGVSGRLVPPRDAAALADTLRRLALDDEERAAMGRAGRAWIERSFTLEDMVRQVSDTYLDAVDAFRGAAP